MGRAPCCDKANVKKGPWSPEEDGKLKEYIHKHGTAGNWIALPQKLGLRRCGKSCRLRWLNYLRPNIKHGEFSDDEDRIICSLFASIGSRWSIMAAQLPGRTDNDIKNYWNTKLKKKLVAITSNTASAFAAANNSNNNNNNYNIAPILSNNYQTPPHHQLAPAPPHFHLPEEPYTVAANFTAGMVSPTQYDNLLGFGGEQQHDHHHHHQDLCYFGSEINDVDHKFLFGASTSSTTATECIDDTMDYGIEEIKQLIGTSNVCGGNLMSFFVDETQTTSVKTEMN